jgi:hypothetical protein
VVQNFHRVEKEMKKARMEMNERIQVLAKHIEQNLESHQIYQLGNFVPCVIPPKGEARIGQAQDYKGPVRSLERIRQIPPPIYQRKKGIILRRTLEKMKFHLSRNLDTDEKEMKKKILEVYDEARRLDDAEFEIQKKELAEGLVSIYKPRIQAKNLNRKIKGFLLSDEVIPIIQERLLNS